MTIQNDVIDINHLTREMVSKMTNTELGELHDLDHDCDESCMICGEMAGRGLIREDENEPDDEDIAYAERCEKEKELNFVNSRGV